MFRRSTREALLSLRGLSSLYNEKNLLEPESTVAMLQLLRARIREVDEILAEEQHQALKEFSEGPLHRERSFKTVVFSTEVKVPV